jgi:hypothetical protein
MAGQLRFFVELQNAVSSAVKQGKKIEEIVTIENGRATATTIKLPESVKNWTGGFLPMQVYDTWREITGHKPAGAIKNGQ